MKTTWMLVVCLIALQAKAQTNYVVEVNSTGQVMACYGAVEVSLPRNAVNPETGYYRIMLTKAEYRLAEAGTLPPPVISNRLAVVQDAASDIDRMDPRLKAILEVLCDQLNLTKADFKAMVKAKEQSQ